MKETPTAQVIPGLKLTDAVITEIIMKHFPDVPREFLASPFRGARCVMARNLIMTFTHIINPKILQKTGLMFNRDHATVLNSFKTIANFYDTCKKTRAFIDELRKELLVDDENWQKFHEQASKFKSFSKQAFLN